MIELFEARESCPVSMREVARFSLLHDIFHKIYLLCCCEHRNLIYDYWRRNHDPIRIGLDATRPLVWRLQERKASYRILLPGSVKHFRKTMKRFQV